MPDQGLKVSTRHPGHPWIRQILLAAYPKPVSCTTYLDAEDLEYRVSRAQEGSSRGRMSLSTDSSTRTTQIVAEYDGVDDGGRSSNFDVTFQVIR